MTIMSKLTVAASIVDFAVKKLLGDFVTVDTVAAAGSIISDAAPLVYGRNVVTLANGTRAVSLPKSDPGSMVEIVNTVANQTLIVFPQLATDQINAITAGEAFSLVGGARGAFFCDAAGHWYVAAANLTGTSTSATTAELNANAGVTLGTSAPSKVLTTDAAESLAWATTDSTASETATLTITDTRTGAGAVGWTEKAELISNVALGSYANALYGLVTFGASGRVTGLAAGICGEITLSAGTTQGTYAAIEAELNVPSGASLGTNTSLMYLSVNGADASTFDTGGYLFNLAGVTAGADTKMFSNAMTIAADELTYGLKVMIAGAAYYIPLCTAADAAD